MSGKRNRDQMLAFSDTVEVTENSPVLGPTAHADISSDSEEDSSHSASFKDKRVVPLEMSDSAGDSPRRKKFRISNVSSDDEEESYEEESELSPYDNEVKVTVSAANAATEVASIVSSSEEEGTISGDSEEEKASSEKENAKKTEQKNVENHEEVDDEEEDYEEEDNYVQDIKGTVNVEIEEKDEKQNSAEEEEEEEEEESDTEESVIIIDDDEDDAVKNVSMTSDVDKRALIPSGAAQLVPVLNQDKAGSRPGGPWTAFLHRNAAENRSQTSTPYGTTRAPCQLLPLPQHSKSNAGSRDPARSPITVSTRLSIAKRGKNAAMLSPPTSTSVSSTSQSPSSLKKTRNSRTTSSASSRTNAPLRGAARALATATKKTTAKQDCGKLPASRTNSPHSSRMRECKEKPKPSPASEQNSMRPSSSTSRGNEASPPSGPLSRTNAAANSFIKKKPLTPRVTTGFGPLPGFKLPGTQIRCASTRLSVMTIELSLMAGTTSNCTCTKVSESNVRKRRRDGSPGKQNSAVDARRSLAPQPSTMQKSLSSAASQDAPKHDVPLTARIRVAENPKKPGALFHCRFPKRIRPHLFEQIAATRRCACRSETWSLPEALAQVGGMKMRQMPICTSGDVFVHVAVIHPPW